MEHFIGFDLKSFWSDSEYAKKEYQSAPFDRELIRTLEEELGFKLPDSYIQLMAVQNGGIPVNDCFPTAVPTGWAPDHAAISGIYGIGYEKACSLGGEFGSRFWIEDWNYPDIGIAICDTPTAGHDMIFLDYRACGPKGNPAVVHIDQEDEYAITPLAPDFESFIRGLVHADVFDDREEN